MKPESLLSTISPRLMIACECVISWSHFPHPSPISGPLSLVVSSMHMVSKGSGKAADTVMENIDLR